MPSTYTLNNGIELIGTGEQSGTWGDTTNTNFELLDTALDGQVSVTLAATGSSGSPNTLPISDGASSNGRNRLVTFGDGGDLGGTAFVQLTPNDAEKIIYVRNNLSGSRSILLFQGTYNASNDYEVPAGTTAVVFFNGAGTGAVAANVFNNAFFDSLRLGSVSVDKILDEDNMASNDAAALATQQSIKAYVDSQVGTVDTLSEILANGNTSGGTNIQMTTTDELQFRDTALKISSSADGQLDIDADTEIEIVAPTVDIDASTAMTIDTAALTVTGAVDFNTSLNVDGTVTSDGVTVAGNLSVDGGTIKLDGNYPTGTQNTALGDAALDSGSLSGGFNTAIGRAALSNNTSASYNSALGNGAMQATTTGDKNTAAGYDALTNNTTGDVNVALGMQSLESNVTGRANTMLGYQSGNLLGDEVVATSIVSGVNYTIQTLGTTDFTLIGAGSNTVGTTFTSTGAGSGTGTASANAKYNTFIGHQSGDVIVGGSKNSIIGRYDGNQGGLDIRNSDNNIVLSDGDGNPRLHIDGSGNVDIINTSDLTVDMKSPGTVTLTIDADTDNSDEGDIPTIILKQDAGLTEMRMGLNGTTDQVYTGIPANMGYIGSKVGIQVAVDFTNTPFPVAQFGESGDITFITAANDQQLKFDYSSGYLGLGLEGSTNPVTLLHVNAPTSLAADAQMVRLSTQAGGALRVHVNDYAAAGPTWSIETGSSEALKFKTGGSIGFQPNENGSDVVNFSTTQILFNTADLEVLGASAALTISNTAETAGKLIINDSADGGQNLTLAYDCQLEDGYLSVDGTTHIYFREDGNTYFGAGGGATSVPFYDAGNATEIFPQIAINSTAAGTKNDGTFAVFSWGAGGNVEPQIILGHSMSGVIGTNSTALVSGNNLGRMLWNGSDGAKMANGAYILCEAADTWTTTSWPSNMIFGVELDATGPRNAMMLSHDGYLGLSENRGWDTGSTEPVSLLHLYGVGAMITVDITGEVEGGIRFRDGDAGTPGAQAAAIKFDSGSAVSNNALSFYNNDEANLAMRIYNNGAVAHPAQPAFHAETTANENPMVNGVITFNSELLDKNADYSTSTGRFTAPVPGLYTFTAVLTFVNGDGVDDSMTMEFEVNGSNYAVFRNDPNVWSNPGEEIPFSISCVVDLAAGDYVTVSFAGVASARPCTLQEPSHFMGHLI